MAKPSLLNLFLILAPLQIMAVEAQLKHEKSGSGKTEIRNLEAPIVQNPIILSEGFSIFVGREGRSNLIVENVSKGSKDEYDILQSNAISLGLGYRSIRVNKMGVNVGVAYNQYEVQGVREEPELEVIRFLKCDLWPQRWDLLFWWTECFISIQ